MDAMSAPTGRVLRATPDPGRTRTASLTGRRPPARSQPEPPGDKACRRGPAAAPYQTVLQAPYQGRRGRTVVRRLPAGRVCAPVSCPRPSAFPSCGSPRRTRPRTPGREGRERADRYRECHRGPRHRPGRSGRTVACAPRAAKVGKLVSVVSCRPNPRRTGVCGGQESGHCDRGRVPGRLPPPRAAPCGVCRFLRQPAEKAVWG